MIAKNMMSIMKENHRNSVWYGDIGMEIYI